MLNYLKLPGSLILLFGTGVPSFAAPNTALAMQARCALHAPFLLAMQQAGTDMEALSVAVSARRLYEDELIGLSDWNLTVLRNVPYARHGYRFSVPRLLNYFSDKVWYRPNTSSESVAARRMTNVEARNIRFVQDYQRRRASGGGRVSGANTSLSALMTAVGERRLNESDLAGKTAWQLTILRNTPYARHGYRFAVARLANYFRDKAWYHPDSNDQDVVSRRFNRYESRNITFIADYQDAHNLRDAP